jgi:cytidyltransferase-like protein
MKIVIASGGFDPVHSGHIKYLHEASKLGDKLIVGVNSDDWLVRKKGRFFMPWEERSAIVSEFYGVTQVIDFDDSDGSACDLIRRARQLYPTDNIIFANGGDRTKDNIPEMIFSDVEFVFGVGGEDKVNSSSWILQEWAAPKVKRQWGYYRVLYELPGCKVKELVVNPGKKLSLQRHAKRSEHWHIAKGIATVKHQLSLSQENILTSQFLPNQEAVIPVGTWHRLMNLTDDPLHVIEIQYGEDCSEEDIERIDDPTDNK